MSIWYKSVFLNEKRVRATPVQELGKFKIMRISGV